MKELDAATFLTPEERQRVQDAIAAAERVTSGEVRVHFDDHCDDDLLDRAAFVFNELGMHRTRERNGVLILVSVLDHGVAIIGDAGIHARVGQHFWDDALELIRLHFMAGRHAQGLIAGIERVGEKLHEQFPFSAGDRDELSNEISFER